jgi:integrase
MGVELGFFKRGRVWWFRTDPITGKPASSKKRDYESAKLEYRMRSKRASDPNYEPETQVEQSLNEWALRFVQEKELMNAAHTAKFYRAKLGHIVRIFGPTAPLSALRPKGFDAYVRQRSEEGARPTTILKEIGAAKALAKHAARLGAFHGKPELFRPPGLKDDYEPGERFLTPEELGALLAVLSEKRAAHVALSVAVGPRFSEATRVLPSDVNLKSWLVFVRGTKTKKAKAWVPIAEPFRPLLVAALPFLPLEPWANMTRDLDRACQRAGVQKVTSNDLRRTHGTWLVEAGVSETLVSRVLRHRDERMARVVYGQPRPEKLGLAIAAQIQQTKSLQSVEDEVEEAAPGTAETPGKVRVAQSVEQRIENPVSRPGEPAQKQTIQRGIRGAAIRGASPDSAESRRVRSSFVTERRAGSSFGAQQIVSPLEALALAAERLLERSATRLVMGRRLRKERDVG